MTANDVNASSGGNDEPDSFGYSPDWKGDVSATELTEAEEARRRELHAAAVRFWELGIRCIPLHWMKGPGQCSCGREDCPSPGKHPVFDKWQKPTTPADTDSGWWRMLAANEQNPVDWSPRSNIGILTGEVSGIFVLDVDCKETDGFATLARAEAQHPDEPIPNTLMVQTGSGGRHYYFRHPGFNVGNTKPWGSKGGVDIRGDQGQVVAPPSISGYGPYVIAANITSASQIAAAPGWLLELIQEVGKQQRGEPSKLTPAAIPAGRIRAYRNSAIKENRRKVAEAPVGSRNDTLNRAAFALGALSVPGIVTQDEAWANLSEAASACGLAAGETRATFASGWRSGVESPFWPPWSEEEDGEFPLFTWDKIGLGDRLVSRYADTLRWSDISNRWMSWRAGRWTLDDRDAGERMALPMIESMSEEEEQHYSDVAESQGVPSPRELFRKWVKSCRNDSAMASAARVARARPSMRIDGGACDADPMLINTRNGVLNAATMEFTQHHPDQLLTMRAGVSYDPEALCARWDAFLAQMQPDPEMRAYLYRIWGYSLTGDYSEQTFFLHHGEGNNGKSVTQDVISSIAGDYGQVVPVETLLVSRNKESKVPNDVARMKGRRFLKCSETAEGRRLDEPLLKSLTGGEEQVARHMRSEFFQFRMVGKVHLTSNVLLHISDDPASWRRVGLIPWLVSIPEDQKNKHLAEELYAEEASGIFNRLLAGLADWRARGGLMPPKAAQAAVQSYRKSEDTFSMAMAALYDIDMDHTECHAKCRHQTAGTEIRRAHREWCIEAGVEPISLPTLYKKLEARKFIKQTYQGKVLFPQIQVRPYGWSPSDD